MQPSNFGHVNAMLITNFTHIEGGFQTEKGRKYVLYTLLVEGRYRFLHPDAYFQGKPCKFNVSPAFKTYVRYRDLYIMHTELGKVFNGLPIFPPKRWFGHRNERFICRRINLLNEYFRQLMMMEDVKGSEALLQVIQPSQSLDLLVLGPARLGKAKFVKRFLHYHPPDIEVSSEYSSLVNHITTRTMSSLFANESHLFSEIEQFTPIDLVINDWLVRVNSVQIMNISAKPSEAEMWKTEVEMSRKDGCVVVYDVESVDSRETTRTLMKKLGRGKCMDLGLAASTASIDSEFAYSALSQFIERLITSPAILVEA